MKPLKRITLGIGALILLAGGLWAGRAAWEFWQEWQLVICRGTLRDAAYTVQFEEASVGEADGARFFRDRAALRDNDGNTVASLGSCRCCGRPYVYSPVNPAGERLVSGDHDHFVLWCPEPCHMGQRAFLTAGKSNFAWRDDQVSWYYQKTADSLTAEELAQEQKYRAEQGMPPLPR
jgi:hypothetical protein